MLEDRPMWATRLFDLYVGPHGGEYAEFIGRQESLREDLMFLLEKMGHFEEFPPNHQEMLDKLGRVNASTCDKPSWDKSLLDRVLDTEHEIIDRFYGDCFGKKLFGKFALEQEQDA